MIDPHVSEAALRQHELERVPFFPQDTHQCGPASLAIVLVHSGVPVTPGELIPRVYIPGRRGSLQVELLGASRRYGRVPYIIEPTLVSLLTELQDDKPVLVLQNLGLKSYPIWHYAVVIGYSAASDSFILRSGSTERLSMPATRFLKTWRHARLWGMILLRPGEMPSTADPKAYLTAIAAFEDVAGADAALPAYRVASERWPENLIARFGLANSLYANGQLAEAETVYRKLLSDHPQHLPALNNLALVLADRGCVSSALATVNEAILQNTAEIALSETLRQTRADILAAKRLGVGNQVCVQLSESSLSP